jgi:molecular chaperone GrpE
MSRKKRRMDDPAMEHENTEADLDLQQELQNLKDRMLRMAADAENTRKRLEREKDELAKYCISAFAKDMLAVRDNLKLALLNCSEKTSPEAISEGVSMTLAELDKIFSRHGIKLIEALGSQFDPNYHQAMFEAPDAEKESGTVVQVVQETHPVFHGVRLLEQGLFALEFQRLGGAP